MTIWKIINTILALPWYKVALVAAIVFLKLWPVWIIVWLIVLLMVNITE